MVPIEENNDEEDFMRNVQKKDSMLDLNDRGDDADQNSPMAAGVDHGK